MDYDLIVQTEVQTPTTSSPSFCFLKNYSDVAPPPKKEKAKMLIITCVKNDRLIIWILVKWALISKESNSLDS